MRSATSFIVTTVLSFIFIACHSESQSVAARTNVINSRFHEVPAKQSLTPLQYDTSGDQNRDIIAQLDAYYKTQVRAGFNGGVLVGFGG